MHSSSVVVTKEGEGVTPGCYSDQDQHLIVRWEPRPEAVLVLTKTVHNGRVGLTHHQQRGSHQNWWICQLLAQCWWWRFPSGWPLLSDLNLEGIDSIIENDIHTPSQLPSNPQDSSEKTCHSSCPLCQHGYICWDRTVTMIPTHPIPQLPSTQPPKSTTMGPHPSHVWSNSSMSLPLSHVCM